MTHTQKGRNSSMRKMKKINGYTCHPFYCDEVPCYLTDECDNKHCPLRRHDVEDKEKADEEKSRF